jgi:cellobiose phosphorylase
LDGAPGSIGEHAWKALELLYLNRGSHGLSLVGDGDWNDALEGISKGGKAESAWLTIALFHSQNVMAELYDYCGDKDKAKVLKERSLELKKLLNEKAWDGEWFVYGFTGSGKPIGSHTNKEGKIHLNSQSWAIFSGLADKAQTDKMRAAVKKYLQTDLGPALLGPPYVEEGAEVGRIARLQPGTFENGSVYQHAVTFHILAEIQSGHPEEAYKSFINLLPTNPDNFDTRRTSEPYCTGNYYCGPGHPRFGQNFFSWFTGNAAWLLRIGFDQLLGVKAEFNGLRIDPKVPAAWDHFSMKRIFRGTHYQFNFQRAKDDVKSLMIDGDKVQGNFVPLQTKKEITVKVFY